MVRRMSEQPQKLEKFVFLCRLPLTVFPLLTAVLLARAPGLRNLEVLHVSRVGPVGVAALAGSPHLTRLKTLYLNGNPVGDDGAEALAASPHLPALEYLQLNDTGVGDRGVTALARSKHLTSLKTLYLGGRCPNMFHGCRAGNIVQAKNTSSKLTIPASTASSVAFT